MFESVTVKLTLWYLAILLSISILFSIAIYVVTSTEVQDRLMGLQQTIEGDGYAYILPPDEDFLNFRNQQASTAAVHLFVSLIYANLVVLIAGGAGSYFLARRTLQPIRRAHDAQSRFVSDASHELRTPLAAMQAELEVTLRDSDLDVSEAREILESNLEEVIKLSNLTTALLKLSRTDAQGITKKPTDITKLVRRVRARYKLPEARISLTVPRIPLYALADSVSLEELFVILIDNALKYSPDSSTIDIQLKRHRGTVGFTITNQGDGIAGDILPHIFNRFYRASKSRSAAESRGFGIGLSLAKRIVELHNGTLSVRSGIDQPTTFTLQLARVNIHKKAKKV